MRTALIAIVLGLFASLNAAAQGDHDPNWVRWENVHFAVCNDAVMVDSLRGYVVGGYLFDGETGHITRTRDGGRTWELMARERNIAYYNLSFFDDRRAVILSEERSPTNPEASSWFIREFVYDQAIRDTAGRILHQFPPNPGQPKWHGVFPGGVAYVSHRYQGEDQQYGRQVIKTTDYGQSWQTVAQVPYSNATGIWPDFLRGAIYIPAPGVIHIVHFSDRTDGKLTKIMSSQDDGKNWRETYQDPAGRNPKFDLYPYGEKRILFPFPNPNIGLVFYFPLDSVLQVNLETGEGELRYFKVEGLVSSPFWPEIKPLFVPTHIHFFNDNVGVAANGASEAWNALASTHDGGLTWKRVEMGTHASGGGMMALHFLSDKVGIALDRNCEVYMTRTGGGLVSRETDLTTGDFRIYPNPAREAVSMRTPSYGLVQFYDLTGRLHHSQSIDKGETLLDVSVWPAGMYFCQITSEGRTKTDKLIILQ